MTTTDEIATLEACLPQCHAELNEAREEDDLLRADLLENDLNHMLERLRALYAKQETAVAGCPS